MKHLLLLTLLLFSLQTSKIEAKHSLRFNQIVRGSPEYFKLRDKMLKSYGKKISPKNFSPVDEIVPGLYLGSQKAYYSIEKCNIKNVLELKKNPYMPQNLPLIWKSLEVSNKPKTKICCYLQEVFGFIDSAKGNVLVFCPNGHSRSATFVIAYLMHKFDIPFEVAYHWVQLQRPSAQPIHAFLNQLQDCDQIRSHL